MTSRKYLKFGLRADKNLSDLSNPSIAVGNLLNNLASGQNLIGEPYLFTAQDILPIRSLSSTDLIDIVNPDTGLPKILTDMEGSIEKFDADLIPGFYETGAQIIQPQITLQDYINRFKVVLGDPPFLDGGSGPSTSYIHPQRLTSITGDISNFTINLDPATDVNHDLVVGNRYLITNLGTDINQANWNTLAGTTGDNYADGIIFVANDTTLNIVGNVNTDAVVRDVSTPSGNFAPPGSAIPSNALPSNVLWTNLISSTLSNVITTGNDWPEDSGNFEWEGSLHPSFTLDYGLVQFTGYQVGSFTPRLECNGLMLVEEDVVDDGTENNWRFVRGTNSTTVKPTYSISYQTVNIDGADKTRITFTNQDDWRRVGIGMAFALEGSVIALVESTSNSSGVYTVTLNSNLGDTNSGTLEYEFVFQLGTDIIYDRLDLTRPRGEYRRRVRYTVWWPESIITNKIFRNINDVSTFTAYDFYKEQLDPSFVTQRFSYPYFRDNRASVTKQKGNTELQIEKKFVNTYQRSDNAKDLLEAPGAFPDYGIANIDSFIDSIEVTVDAGGKVVPTNGTNIHNAVLGDHLVTSYYDISATEQKYFSFQLNEMDIDDDSQLPVGAYVNSEYLTKTGLDATTIHKAILVKNNGLIGIYKTTTTDSSTNSIVLETTDEGTLGDGTTAKKPFEIDVDSLIYKVEDGPFIPTSDGQGGFTLNTNTTHSTHAKAFRILTIDHDGDRSVTTANTTLEANPVLASGGAGINAAEANVSAINGIAIVYASRGLIDRSAVEECSSVYGKEVTALASPTDSQIVLKDTTGISVGDFIYFDGVIPYDNTSANTMTRVKQIVNSTTIEMGNGGVTPNNAVAIPAGKSLNPGVTVVLVPHQAGPDNDGWGMLNKEYCIIPLNTAPPWDSTDVGLASPSFVPSGESIPKNYSVMAKEFRYTSLEFKVPDVNLTSYGIENNTPRTKYLEVSYVLPETD